MVLWWQQLCLPAEGEPLTDNPSSPLASKRKGQRAVCTTHAGLRSPPGASHRAGCWDPGTSAPGSSPVETGLPPNWSLPPYLHLSLSRLIQKVPFDLSTSEMWRDAQLEAGPAQLQPGNDGREGSRLLGEVHPVPRTFSCPIRDPSPFYTHPTSVKTPTIQRRGS